MYCCTYVNSYDAIGSVIPREKWHKHQCFRVEFHAPLVAVSGRGHPFCVMEPELSK